MHTLSALLLAALPLLATGAVAQRGRGPMAMPVKAVPVIQDTVIADIAALGTLGSEEGAMSRPEIAGRIETIHVQEGQRVNQGDSLVTLDPAEYRAKLEGSAAQVKMEQITGVVNGKAALTPVKLGQRRPGQVEILDGLSAADQVITDGQIKLQDGVPVTVLPASPAVTSTRK